MDTCGKCMISKQGVYQAPDQAQEPQRRKRDLSHIMKRSVVKEECPCGSNEARDACGVCKPVGENETNGKIVPVENNNLLKVRNYFTKFIIIPFCVKQYTTSKTISDCNHIKVEPSFIDIALNSAFIKLKLKGTNINEETYTKEGSTCTLKPNSNATSSIEAKIESLSNDFAEIRVDRPKTWKHGWINNKESQHQSFNVICYLKQKSENITEERTTRPIVGGGMDDEYIHGGGLTVVNSNDIKIKDVSVPWKQPPMTYDVSNNFNISYNFFRS